MTQVNSLIQIGSRAKVALALVRDRIPGRLIQLLSDHPFGTVIDYKMTDGRGIGFVLEFSDGSIYWFFDDEIGAFDGEKITLNFNNEMRPSLKIIDSLNKSKNNIQIFDQPIHTEKKMIDLLNPVKFLRWLLYSLKDVY